MDFADLMLTRLYLVVFLRCVTVHYVRGNRWSLAELRFDYRVVTFIQEQQQPVTPTECYEFRLGIAIPDVFSNPGISGLKNANPGIPGLNPGIESLILN